jgi:hypothetical protein
MEKFVMDLLTVVPRKSPRRVFAHPQQPRAAASRAAIEPLERRFMLNATLDHGLDAPSLQNGNFASGDLTGWSSAGNTSVQDTRNPANAYLTEAPPSGNEFISLVSGGRSTADSGPGNPVAATQLDAALGIKDTSPKSLVSQGFTAGSVIYQQVRLKEGDTITFNENFLTDQANNGTGAPEAGVFILSPTKDGSPRLTLFANPTKAPNASKSPFAFETGWAQFISGPARDGGVYTIAIAELNIPDNLNPSAVLVDNVQIIKPHKDHDGWIGELQPLPTSWGNDGSALAWQPGSSLWSNAAKNVFDTANTGL